MTTTLVTGCNRGIGLELVSQLHDRGDTIIGVCRKSSPALEQLGIRVIDGIDVTDPDSIARLKAEIGDLEIDVLVNNAGILVHDQFGELDYATMMRQYEVNALGPLRVTEALASNLHEGSRVAIVTSRVGSVGDNGSGGHFGYRASKAAVNMIGMNLVHEFRPRGIAVALLHPGFVATDMTGRKGIAAKESARGLIERIGELNMETTGTFWHAEGFELPW